MAKLNPIRILIVDDDEDDFLLTADYLKGIEGAQFEIDWAPSYRKGLARIKECVHDVFIVDYYLGAYNGLELIREAIKAQCDSPMILLTGVNNPEVDEAAAGLGVFDYLVKGSLTTDRLQRSIRYSLAQSDMMKAVKENEAKFRTIFEKSRDMVFVTDASGQLTSVSNSAGILTGFATQELLGMTIYDLFADKAKGKSVENILGDTGEISDCQFELLTQNKERRICTIYATVQPDRHGKKYCQGVLHDLTAKIRERRATVLSEKMESTGRLMRMLAHEVRNPLTNIGLAVEGFAGELLPGSDQQEYVEIIKRNAQRINNLVTQLLDSSRPTALRPELISVRAVLAQTLEEAYDRLTLKKIKVLTHFASGNDTVVLDTGKIKIAFTNIIVNAIEAMPEETGVLQIITKRDAQQLIVSISDNGSGISQDHLNRLFEPYFTSKPGGMGLGLAATLNIVQSHGGSVDVESVLGTGTTFSLTFSLPK